MNIENLRKKQILEFCKSCLDNYVKYLTPDEINLINDIISNNVFSKDIQEKLLIIAEKIWNNELLSGKYKVISWSKFATQKRKNFITFATLSKIDEIDTFCGSDFGIEYSITYKSIIGALNKDGATLIEDINKQNDFTLAIINDKAINSYNGATKFITPIQLLDKSDNTYRSKHNELILDSTLIKEIGEFELSSYKNQK